MPLPANYLEIIRECSRDDDAFQRLAALFESASEPQIAVHSQPASHTTNEASPYFIDRVLSAIPDMVYVHDLIAGRNVYINREIARWLGYTPEEIQAMGAALFATILHPDDLPRVIENNRRFNTLGEHETLEIEYQMRHKDGTWRWLYSRDCVFTRDAAGQAIQILGIAQDITERKRAEAHEAHLAAIVSSSTEAIIGKALDGTITSWNRAAETMYGYTAEEAVGQSVKLIVPPDQIDALTGFLERIGRGERIEHHETARIRKDGTRLDVLLSISPVMDYRGRISGAAGISVDITDLKQAQHELTENEQRFRTISGLISDYAYGLEVHPDGTMTRKWLVGAFAAITGYMSEELDRIGGWEALVYPPDMAITQRRKTRLLSGLDDVSEFRILTRAQEIRWLRDYGHPIWDEQHRRVTSILGGAQDITERKRMEQALRDSEERYRLVINSMAEGVVVHGRDGAFQACNAAAERILGLTADQLMGRSPTDPSWHTIHEDGSPLPLEEYPVMVALSTGQPVSSVILGLCKPDLPVTWISANAQPLLHPETGVPYGVVSTFVDITEQKQARQREFEIAMEKERMNMLTQFIASASHEFRTPLAIINMSTYLLLRSEDELRRGQHAGHVQQQVARITKLLDMLLKALELTTGGAHLVREPVRLRQVVALAQEEVAPENGHGPTFRYVEAPNLPILQGNADALTEALRQLLENAYRFTPPDGTITVSASIQGESLVLEVRDTGSGISQADMAHIFELFWRKDKAHSTPGFGLGLSIVHQIVHLHGGRVEVESAEGQGSTFRLLLPLG